MDQRKLGNGSDKQIELKLDGIEIKPCIKGRDILSFHKVVRAAAYGHRVKGSMEQSPNKPCSHDYSA